MFLRIICLEYNLPYVQSDFMCIPGPTVVDVNENRELSYK